MKTVEQTLETEPNQANGLPYGIELDENGIPIDTYSVQEVFDEFDQGFIKFYGEYGRQLVNQRRERWNDDGVWEFKLF